MRGRCKICGYPYDRDDLIDGMCWECIQDREIDVGEDADFCRRLEQGFDMLRQCGDWDGDE